MGIKTKTEKNKDEKYVLLCAMSENDAADAQKTAAELTAKGVQARVINCYNKKYKELFKLAESGNCIYCGIFTHLPVPEEIALRLCDKVRLYAFMQESDHDRREGERRSGKDRRSGDRRTGDRRSSGDRRNGERRTAGDRRVGDRRESASGSAAPDAAAQTVVGERRAEDRRDGDRRGEDRRCDDRRGGDRRQTERRMSGERRSGVDRRSGSHPVSVRRVYTLLVDSGLPEGQQLRSLPKTNKADAVSLLTVNEEASPENTGSENTGGKNKSKKTLSARSKALIIAAALVLIYLILYLASFYGCIGPIY